MSRYTVNVGSDCSRRSRSSSCHKGGEGSGWQKQWVLQALVLEGCTYAAAVCVCAFVTVWKPRHCLCRRCVWWRPSQRAGLPSSAEAPLSRYLNRCFLAPRTRGYIQE